MTRYHCKRPGLADAQETPRHLCPRVQAAFSFRQACSLERDHEGDCVFDGPRWSERPWEAR